MPPVIHHFPPSKRIVDCPACRYARKLLIRGATIEVADKLHELFDRVCQNDEERERVYRRAVDHLLR